MEFEQLNLDILPINPLVEADSLEYKAQLNLAFNTSQALYNIEDYLRLLNKKLQQQPNTVKTLNLVLESYLYILLSTSTISSLDNSKLSSFYSRKKRLDIDYFETVNSQYADFLNYTNYRVWGTPFGSLGYYLYLSQNTLHFSHPSNLIRISLQELLNRLNLPELSKSTLNLINSEDTEADYQLYLQSTSILRELDLLSVIAELNFFEEWAVSLLNWYSSVTTEAIVNPYDLNSTASKSFNLLVEMAKEIVKVGLFNESFSNLSYKFLHQEIDSLVLDSLQNIINLKRLNQFEITSDLTKEEVLLNQLFNRRNKITPEFITAESYRLLSINLSGGLNMWFTSLAAELVNRAYILTFSQYSSNLLYPIENNEGLISLMNRVYKLVFYAGYCLKKTNLNHLQLIGANLRVLSQLEDNNEIEEFDLLT